MCSLAPALRADGGASSVSGMRSGCVYDYDCEKLRYASLWLDSCRQPAHQSLLDPGRLDLLKVIKHDDSISQE